VRLRELIRLRICHQPNRAVKQTPTRAIGFANFMALVGALRTVGAPAPLTSALGLTTDTVVGPTCAKYVPDVHSHMLTIFETPTFVAEAAKIWSTEERLEWAAPGFKDTLLRC
jgi:hypothetical protein